MEGERVWSFFHLQLRFSFTSSNCASGFNSTDTPHQQPLDPHRLTCTELQAYILQGSPHARHRDCDPITSFRRRTAVALISATSALCAASIAATRTACSAPTSDSSRSSAGSSSCTGGTPHARHWLRACCCPAVSAARSRCRMAGGRGGGDPMLLPVVCGSGCASGFALACGRLLRWLRVGRLSSSMLLLAVLWEANATRGGRCMGFLTCSCCCCCCCCCCGRSSSSSSPNRSSARVSIMTGLVGPLAAALLAASARGAGSAAPAKGLGGGGSSPAASDEEPPVLPALAVATGRETTPACRCCCCCRDEEAESSGPVLWLPKLFANGFVELIEAALARGPPSDGGRCCC